MKEDIQELLKNYNEEVQTLFVELRNLIYESVNVNKDIDKDINKDIDKDINKNIDINNDINNDIDDDIDEKLWAKLPSYYNGKKFVRLIPFKDHINIEAEAIGKYKREFEQFKVTPKGMLQIYLKQELPSSVLKVIFAETLL